MTDHGTYHDPGSPFDGAPIISVYGDDQAVEDGVLVAYDGPRIRNCPLNRVTRAVFNDYCTDIANAGIITDVTRLARLCERAVADGKRDDDWIIYEEEGRKFWIIPNELGGYTLMYPDDY